MGQQAFHLFPLTFKRSLDSREIVLNPYLWHPISCIKGYFIREKKKRKKKMMLVLLCKNRCLSTSYHKEKVTLVFFLNEHNLLKLTVCLLKAEILLATFK